MWVYMTFDRSHPPALGLFGYRPQFIPPRAPCDTHAMISPQVFKLEGICERDIGKLSARSKDLNRLHGRLAAAVLLDMCHDEDLHDVVAGWGEKERLLKSGEEEPH